MVPSLTSSRIISQSSLRLRDVEAGGRLVQEEHRWSRDQRCRDVEAPAHAAGVGAQRTVRGAGEVEPPEELVGPRQDLGSRHLREHADHPKVLPAGQVGVDGRVLAGQADPPAHGVGLFDDVVAEDLRPAAVGKEHRRQDPYGRRLAGPVRTQESEDGSLGDLQVDPGKRHHLAVPLAETLDHDRSIAHGLDVPIDGRGCPWILVLGWCGSARAGRSGAGTGDRTHGPPVPPHGWVRTPHRGTLVRPRVGASAVALRARPGGRGPQHGPGPAHQRGGAPARRRSLVPRVDGAARELRVPGAARPRDPRGPSR